jgi:Icc-related predicted phosphoesterase
LQIGIYDLKLVTMTNKKSLLTRFFLMKSPIYDNLFRSPMQEAVQEQMRDALVMSYGTFSPPTEEHIKLLKKVVASAGQVNGSNIVFIAQDKQFSHDEMSLRQKAEVLKEAVPQLNICYDEGLFDIYDAFVWAYTRHYKDVYVIAGSDEVSDINQILESSNGQETEDGYFEFNKYKVISYGGGNPDRTPKAAEAKNAILNGDFDAFLRSVQGPEFPKFSHAKKLFQIMQYEYKNSVGMSGI